MIHQARWTIAIPLLLWMAPYETAFAADGSLTCPDGHKISASTGSSGGSCDTYSNLQINSQTSKGVVCTDGAGNSGQANCSGQGKSTGSGGYAAKQNPVQQGSTSPPNSAAGIKKPTSAGAAMTSPSGGRKILPTTTTTTPSALTNPSILGGSSGAGSATTAGSKAKLPTSGTSTQGH